MITLQQGVTSDSEPLPNPMTWEEYARFASKQARYCIDEKTGALELIGEEIPKMQNTGRMTKEEYYTFVEKLFADMLAMIKRKSADYCGKEDDPFKNYRRAENVGVDPLAGLAVRFEDKVARVESFFQNGNLQNESFEDAWLDIIGYSCSALGVLHERKRLGGK
jgi:hypothetical protein